MIKEIADLNSILTICRVYGVLGFLDRELLHLSLEEFVKKEDFYQIQKGITEGEVHSGSKKFIFRIR